MTYIIKYYKNRKLYSPDAARYVNLSECKTLIDEGYSVRFIEHKTGMDVTDRCLKEMLRSINVTETGLLNLIRKL